MSSLPNTPDTIQWPDLRSAQRGYDEAIARLREVEARADDYPELFEKWSAADDLVEKLRQALRDTRCGYAKYPSGRYDEITRLITPDQHSTEQK